MKIIRRFLTRHKSSIGIKPITEKLISKPRLFVHIPKTGGTSFRRSTLNFFGSRKVLYDYGQHASETSPGILATIYETGDVIALEQSTIYRDIELICGHFNIAKYTGLVGVLNSIVIFRNPAERVVSHYIHAVNYQKFVGNFQSFIQKPDNQNIQSKYVSGLDPALLGVVGITECFQSLLDILNNRLGWGLEFEKENVRLEKSGIDFSPSEKDLDRIREFNVKDFAIYERACRVFENSLYCQSMEIPYEPRGSILNINCESGITGWAFNMNSTKSTEIEVIKNGAIVNLVKAVDFRPGLAAWNVPRYGYIGFRSQIKSLCSGDQIEIREKKSGICLDKIRANTENCNPPGN